jgi:RND superfamily putative drug exporter
MLVRAADWCYRRRRLVVLAWIGALVGTIVLAGAFGGEFRQDYLQPGSESKAAVDLLKERFPQRSGDTVQVVFHAPGGIAAVKPRIVTLLDDVKNAPHVVEVDSPFAPGGQRQISQDGTTAYADVDLDKLGNEITVADAKLLIDRIRKADGDGLQVETGGQVATMAQSGQIGSEGIGFLAAAVILLVTFGSAVAMGLPLLTAVFGIGIASALAELLRHVVPVPDWAPSVALMIGLGVGIDYALFIVTRYRSGLAEGQDPREATTTAIGTAGRAVLFAGCTVVISMLGMLLMSQPFTAGVAFSAVLAVLVIMAAAVTLLPAVLGFAGRNIERLHVPFVGKKARAYDDTGWYRWSRFIQHRPWPAAVGGLVVLLALAAPVFGVRFGFPDSGNDPKTTSTRRAYDLLAQGFGAGFNGPVLITAELRDPADIKQVNALGDTLRGVPGVANVSPAVPNQSGDTAIVQVFPTTSPQDKRTEDLVDHLRKDVVPKGGPVTYHVGGLVAGGIDSTRGVTARLPVFIGAVVLLSFLLLLLVFRSVLVPLKAAVMNLLSIAAAYGVMSLAVNGGPLGRLVGIPDPTPVPSFIPMMMFAILFGLSMDYEVFLLSRVREEYDRTHDNGLAVADGLAKTARVITAAAAIMITVFLAFVPSEQVFLKMIGIGLASAIFVDATLVRLVLVPATMELLGDRNWWLPGWLDRILPRVSVEPAHAAALDLRDAAEVERAVETS